AALVEAAAAGVAPGAAGADRCPGPRPRHGRGRSRRLVQREHRTEVDVDELVAVHGVEVAALAPLARRELDPAAAAEPVGLLGDGDVRAEARQLALEERALTDGARDDHASDAGVDEPGHLVGDEGAPGD